MAGAAWGWVVVQGETEAEAEGRVVMGLPAVAAGVEGGSVSPLAALAPLAVT